MLNAKFVNFYDGSENQYLVLWNLIGLFIKSMMESTAPGATDFFPAHHKNRLEMILIQPPF